MTKKEIHAIMKQIDDWSEKFPRWRKGQTLFNAIYATNPEVGNKIRGSKIDPFHDDSKIEECLDYIKEI